MLCVLLVCVLVHGRYSSENKRFKEYRTRITHKSIILHNNIKYYIDETEEELESHVSVTMVPIK